MLLSRRGLPAGLASAAPMQRPAALSRAPCVLPLAAKGSKQQKVNKRGKVSSRPGPPSPNQQQQPGASAPPPQPSQAEQQPTPGQPAAAQQPQPMPQQQPTASTSSSSSGPQAPSISETPQVVVDRMFRRVVTFAGLPVALGVVLFPVFWYLRVVQKVEYPLWIVYVTQAAMFGGGLLGITYGILSTSWDPRREGSALGFTEFQANLPILLNRSKEQQ